QAEPAGLAVEDGDAPTPRRPGRAVGRDRCDDLSRPSFNERHRLRREHWSSYFTVPDGRIRPSTCGDELHNRAENRSARTLQGYATAPKAAYGRTLGAAPSGCSGGSNPGLRSDSRALGRRGPRT